MKNHKKVFNTICYGRCPNSFMECSFYQCFWVILILLGSFLELFMPLLFLEQSWWLWKIKATESHTPVHYLILYLKVFKYSDPKSIAFLRANTFLGFFLATSTTCFLSFIFNIYPKLNFDYGLISLLLQFPYAILIKVMLNADAYEVLQSDRHEGIEGPGQFHDFEFSTWNRK